MRKNMTKRKLLSGGCVFGVFVAIPSPRLVELCGLAGFDYVVIDAEHGPIDVSMCEDMVRAAEVMELTPIVRVPENDPKIILRYLDVGAQGVMVPQVNARADAERAIEAIKYAPLGCRGLAAPRAASYGYGASLSDYARSANEETMFLAQVENIQALQHLDEILAVEGVDVIELGVADLSQSLGHPGETTHPDVRAVVDEIVTRAIAAGKVVGDTISDPVAAKAAIGRGIRKIDCSLIGLTLRALGDFSRTVNQAASQASKP